MYLTLVGGCCLFARWIIIADLLIEGVITTETDMPEVRREKQEGRPAIWFAALATSAGHCFLTNRTIPLAIFYSDVYSSARTLKGDIR